MLITPITSQTCHAKPKTQINRRRTTRLLSRWWDACRKQLGLKDFISEKVGSTSGVRQIKERGALPMIDRGDIRQAIDRCNRIWAFYCQALVMVSSSIRLTA